MKAEALVNALGYTLTEIGIEKLSDTLAKVKAKALVDALENMQAEVESESLSETVKA